MSEESYNKYIRFDQAAASVDVARAPTVAELEHSLATAFVELQRERNPERRQGLWLECQRLAKELEKLSNESNKV